MKYYVIHYSPLVDRRKKLEKQFEERGITNVEWIIDFSNDTDRNIDEHLRKIKKFTSSLLPLGCISLNMKSYTIFKKMVDENVPHAIVFEDDSVFTEHWDISKIPMDLHYVKLCKPVGDSFCTCDGTPFVCMNNGFSQAYYLTKHFAEFSLKNIELRKTIDIEIHKTLIKFYNTFNFLCYPMVIEDVCESSHSPPTHDKEPWIEYIQNFSHPVFDYDELVQLGSSDPHLILSNAL